MLFQNHFNKLFSHYLGICNLILRVSDDAQTLAFTHSRMGHYFFSYLLTWEVDLIEILEIIPQMWQYVIFLSLKPTKVTLDFILN